MEDYKKKYEQALARAREIHRNEDEKRFDMEWLFPELKESEDERIRKEIIAILQYKYEKFSKDPKYCNAPQWIAWLEKQGPKPAWSEEDDSMFQSCIGAVATNDYYKGEEKEQIYDWLKTLKQRLK